MLKNYTKYTEKEWEDIICRYEIKINSNHYVVRDCKKDCYEN